MEFTLSPSATEGEESVTDFSAGLLAVEDQPNPVSSPALVKRIASMSQSADLVSPFMNVDGLIQSLEQVGMSKVNAQANVKLNQSLLEQQESVLRSYLNGESDVGQATFNMKGIQSSVNARARLDADADTGALEKAFVDNAAPDLEQEARTFLQRNLAFERLHQEMAQGFSEQSTTGKVLDFVSLFGQSVVPFYQGASASDDLEGVEGSWWLGKNSSQVYDYLISLPEGEFEEAFANFSKELKNSNSVFGENYLASMIAVEGITSGGKTRELDDLLTTFDAVTLGSATALGAVKAMRKASTVRQAEEALGKTSAKVDPDLDNPAETLPTGAVANGAASVEDGAATFKPTSTLEEIIELNEGVNIYRNLDRGEALSEVDAARASDSALRTLRSELGPAEKVKPRINNTFVTKTPGDIEIQNIVVGKADGSGYKSKAGALKGGNRLSPNRKGEAIQDPVSGMWYMQYSKAIKQTGFADDIQDMTEIRANAWNRWLSSSEVTSNKTLQSNYKQALMSGSRLGATFGNRIKKAIGGLDKDTRNQMEGVIAKLRDEPNRSEWYDSGEFLAEFRRLGGKESKEQAALEGYYVAKEANDLDFFVRNDIEYRKLVNAGYESLIVPKMFDAPVTVRKIDTTNLDFESVRVFDADGAATITTKAELDEAVAKGASVYRSRTAVDTPDGPSNLIVTRQGKVSSLDYQQIGYRPGGHRIYDGSNFVKQKKSFLSGGKTYVTSPLTHIVTQTPKQAKAWADSMNEIRDVMKQLNNNQITKDNADEMIEQLSPTSTITSSDDYTAALKDGAITDSEFEVLKDGEPIHKPEIGEAVLFDEESMDVMSSYIDTGARGLNSRRSKFLVDETDQQAPVLSPVESIEKAYSSIMNRGVFSNYQQRAIDSWVNAAKREKAFTVESTRSLKNASNFDIFKNGKLETDNTALDTQRANINRQLNMGDPLGQYYERQRRFAADWILDSTHPAVGKRLRPLVDKANDPLSVMKGLAFNAWLGFFNIDQLVVQTQTILAVNSIAPGAGMRSVTLSPVLLAQNLPDSAVLKYAQGTKLAHGLDPKEVVTMRNQMRESGWQNVDATIAFLDNNQTHALGIGSAVKNFSERSRVFFYAAEKANRTHAYSVAWMRFKKRYPDVDPTSEFGRRTILDDADTLTMSMTRASQAAWQRGPISAMTQFQSYAAHLTENMLPQMLGGSRNLNGAEKLRLAAGQLLFYGTAGLPIAYLASDALLGGQGEVGDENLKEQLERHKLLSRGALDAVIRNALGVDSDLSARVGLGNQVHQLYRDLSEKNLIEAVGGPSLNFGANVSKSLMDTITLAKASKGDIEVTSNAVWDVLRNIKSLDNGTKAYMAWNNGQYLSKTGRLTEGVDNVDAVAIQFGFGPTDQRQVSDILFDNKRRKEAFNSVQKLVTEQANEANRAYASGDRDAWQAHLKTISVLVRSVPIEERNRIEFDPETLDMAHEMYWKDWKYRDSDKSQAFLNETIEKNDEVAQ